MNATDGNAETFWKNSSNPDPRLNCPTPTADRVFGDQGGPIVAYASHLPHSRKGVELHIGPASSPPVTASRATPRRCKYGVVALGEPKLQFRGKEAFHFSDHGSSMVTDMAHPRGLTFILRVEMDPCITRELRRLQGKGNLDKRQYVHVIIVG